MRFLKRESTYKFAMYLFFALVIFWRHLPATYFSDDAKWSAMTATQSWVQRLIQLYFYNGRVLTDGFANLFYRVPMLVWQVFDTGVFLLVAWLLVRAFTKNTWKDVLTVCALVGLFPYAYLSNAGWVATAANYLYTVLCLLVITNCLASVERGNTLSRKQWTVIILCILYAANHDQTAVVLIGGLTLYLLYHLATKTSREKIRTVSVLLAVSILVYAGMFLMPGHINRMNSTEEMEYWLPQYKDWSLLKKLWTGYSTTAGLLVFGDVKVFSLLCFLLLALAVCQKRILPVIMAAIPTASVLLDNIFGSGKFLYTYSYSCSMPELLPLDGSLRCLIPTLITVAVIVCLVYTICASVSGKPRWLMLMLLTLGAGSREMMGLSATVYASSFRTFTVFLFCIIICCLLVLEQLKQYHKSWPWYIGIAAAAGMYLL